MIKIPQLKSRYIPVFAASYSINNNIQWWKPNDPYYYPYVLLNLDTINKGDIPKLEFPDSMFLLTDSGGFQVIAGTCNYDYKSSLQKQIELGASKIFSFDKPPVERTVEGQNIFTAKFIEESKKQIEENLDVAIKQSKWLQENRPEKVKDFCYVLHANSKEMLDYNIELIKEKLGGSEGYKKHFGGVCYAVKKSDYIFLTTCAAHAKKYFVDKDFYVHFLGIGSFSKFIIMIKYNITTFDSSNALRGAISWSMNSPFNTDIFGIRNDDYPFTKQFCTCPVCSKIDYNQLRKENKDTIVGRWFVVHNLWQILKINVFLDSLDKKNYTKLIRKYFTINKDINRSLDYMDDIDKMGLEIAYEKWKYFIKKDESKQQALF